MVEKQVIALKFQRIIGTIVVLASPLSVGSLASLVGIIESTVICIFVCQHSVLSIPTDHIHPVRLLHFWFRDFLFDKQKKDSSPFWVDEKKTRENSK